MDYIIFIFSAVLVIYSGIKLSEYGDLIAIKTSLGHSFIGVTLIALFTSLPELISSIGSVTIVKAPDLAMGNVYGSNMFNMLIIFFLDALFKKDSVFKEVSLSNFVTAIFAVLLGSVSILGFIMDVTFLEYMSVVSIAIFVIYILSMYSAYRSIEKVEPEAEEKSVDIPLKKAIFMFGLMAIIIIFAGLMMSKSADEIAQTSGLGRTVIGSFLLAVVTSLPEVSACIGAVKVGAVNMAVGNLFGSNVFNMTVIPVADIFYTSGNIFKNVNSIHLFSATSSCIVVLIAMLGIKQDKLSKFRFGHVSLYSVYILMFYVLYFVVLTRG